MAYINVPNESFLHDLESFTYSDQKRWRDKNGERIFTWDGTHGEVEVFNKRGEHLGAVDPLFGKWVKNAKKGRRIDVK